MPALNYKWLMLHTCQSSIYYADAFNHGILFSTASAAYAGDEGVKLFVQAVIEDQDATELLGVLNVELDNTEFEAFQ